MIPLLSSLLTIIIVSVIVKLVLPVKIKKSSICIIICTALIVLYIFPVLIYQDFIPIYIISGVGVIYSFLLPLLIYHYKFKTHIIYLLFLITGINFIVMSSIHWVTGIDFHNIINASLLEVISIISIFLLCIILCKKNVLSKIFQNILLIQNYLKTLFIIIIWVSAFLGMFFTYLSDLYSDLPGFDFLGTVLAIFIISVGIMCPLFIINSLSRIRLKSLSDLMEKQVNAQIIHYELMNKMNEDLRKFKHDYINLSHGLESYLKQGDTQSALKYLKSDEMSLDKTENKFKTSNIILDALITEKQFKADTINTEIIFEGYLLTQTISTADICIIFGNALDNAIEACEKITDNEKKVIKIKIKQTKNHLHICIENPVTSEIPIFNNTLITTKKDTRSHGIGLSSIQATIKKYSGIINLTCAKKIFCIEIDLEVSNIQ